MTNVAIRRGSAMGTCVLFQLEEQGLRLIAVGMHELSHMFECEKRKAYLPLPIASAFALRTMLRTLSYTTA